MLCLAVLVLVALSPNRGEAADGTLWVANLSYGLPVDFGPVHRLTFYNDYSILFKDDEDFDDSQINTLGCSVDAAPVFAYIDLIFGKNAPFLGLPDDPVVGDQGLAEGRDADEWSTRFNINVGYYF